MHVIYCIVYSIHIIHVVNDIYIQGVGGERDI